jgi:hypothetical protein
VSRPEVICKSEEGNEKQSPDKQEAPRSPAPARYAPEQVDNEVTPFESSTVSNHLQAMTKQWVTLSHSLKVDLFKDGIVIDPNAREALCVFKVLGIRKISSTEVNAGELCAEEVGAAQTTISQVGIDKSRTGEVGVFQIAGGRAPRQPESPAISDLPRWWPVVHAGDSVNCCS